MRWEIRRAGPGDAPQLSAIAWAAKSHWGYPASWLEAWREELTVSPAYIEAHSVFVAVGPEADLAGFYALSQESGNVELEHFWVRPETMGRGVGRALFEHAVAEARARHSEALHIDADPHAAGFYERMGAELVGAVPAPMDGEPRVRPQYRLRLRATQPDQHGR